MVLALLNSDLNLKAEFITDISKYSSMNEIKIPCFVYTDKRLTDTPIGEYGWLFLCIGDGNTAIQFAYTYSGYGTYIGYTRSFINYWESWKQIF